MKLSSLYDTTIDEAVKRTNRRSKFQSALRHKAKSQVEVADNCDVDESTISRYKTGTRNPSLSTMRRLAKQGLDVVDLFDIKSDAPSKPKKRKIRRTREAVAQPSGQIEPRE